MDDSVGDVIRISLLGVLALVTIVAAGAFSKKLGVAAPLILIVVGVGFSFIPGAPVVVPHEVILLGLLPPILYSAALTVPVIDFRRNLTSISLLSVALVIVTAGITGFILYLLFPQLSLAAGIAIGAVISPTDAVAATALGKRLGLPPRLVTILEGEGLVNDATALVLLRSAVAGRPRPAERPRALHARRAAARDGGRARAGRAAGAARTGRRRARRARRPRAPARSAPRPAAPDR